MEQNGKVFITNSKFRNQKMEHHTLASFSDTVTLLLKKRKKRGNRFITQNEITLKLYAL